MRRAAVSFVLGMLLLGLIGFIAHRRLAPDELEPAASADEVTPEGDALASAASEPGAAETNASETARGALGAASVAETNGPTAEATEGQTEASSAAPEADPAEANAHEAAPAAEASAEVSSADVAPAPSPPREAPLDADEVRAAAARAGRPLRVVATRWDVAAPILLASGLASAAPAGSGEQHPAETDFAVLASADAVEEALARGGDAPAGADVAILSLASWVESHEHLAGLDLQAFLVAGWSRGETLYYASPDALDPALAAPRVEASVSLASASGLRGSLPLLVLLAELGVPPRQARFVGVDDPRAGFIVTEREGRALAPAPMGHALWFSSADAPRLAPWVVVAPRAIVRTEQPRLARWARAWLEGASAIDRDMPAAARTISALPDAPPLVDLLGQIGRIERVGLAEQVALAGLSPTPRVTLADYFERAWRWVREAGLVSGGAPDATPIATGIVSSLARDGVLRAPSSPRCPEPEAPRALVGFPIALPRALPRGGELPQEAIERLAFVAQVFSRSRVELVVPRGASAIGEALVRAATERGGLDAGCVTVVPGASALVRVLAPQ